MLYTGKGDDGNTNLYGCSDRISKAGKIAEALGALDEINSLLGLVKAKVHNLEITIGRDNRRLAGILSDCQQNLFTIQAELAGADKKISEDKIKKVEEMLHDIEDELPPIHSFFVSGAIEMSAYFDYARTVARRAERRVVDARDEREVSAPAYAYLNRLSSLLFGLARLVAHRYHASEEKPTYK